MGLFDALKKKPEEAGQQKEAEAPEAEASQGESTGKFNEVCALCGKGPTDVKWMGQFWHQKCRRVGKRMAKKMM